MPETKFELIGTVTLGVNLWLGPEVHVKAGRRHLGLSVAADADAGRVFVESAEDGTPLRIVVDFEDFEEPAPEPAVEPAAATESVTEPAAEPAATEPAPE